MTQIAAQTTVFYVGASLLAIKVWLDIVQFLYYRERVQACKHIVSEGAQLIRLAIERGVLK